MPSRTVACILIAVLNSPLAAQHLAFKASSVDGKIVKIGDGAVSAVCFLGTECPMARAYGSTLNDLAERFADQGVQVVGVMSNVQDSEQDIREYRKALGIEFPIVHDSDGSVADKYGATRTPEAYLVDATGILRYHGRIDDQYAPGVARSAARREDLRIAIEQLLAGKPITIRDTDALGCIIGRRPDSTQSAKQSSGAFTYHRDVLPVLIRNCIECHRRGDIGPFEMDDYDEVVGWAETMLETIDDKRMPPWHASPDVGSFSNARSISPKDIQVFRQWVESGMLEGNEADAPEMPEFTEGWQLTQEPDDVYPMRGRPFVVPKDGVVEYQYFVVDPGFKEDVWIKEAQIVPGARDVVHHAIVFVRPPDGERFSGVGWLSAYVPGQRAIQLPSGYARRVPAGSKFVFQMHYTPVGIKRKDVSRLGVVFAEQEKVTHEVYTIAALDQEFEIPPEVEDHRVKSKTFYLPDAAELLAATPHMHLRGRSFKLWASGDDERSALLEVPRYDFNWQHTYHLSEPVNLDAYEHLEFEAVFDNSAGNAFNPDPDQWVMWGDQSWEEMAVAFFDVAQPLKRPKGGLVKNQAEPRNDQDQRQAAKAWREKMIAEYVEKALEKMDANGDGVIYASETEVVVRHISFVNWDINSDGKVTRDELTKVAEGVYK
ncbi:MAG TPA: alkyl hydroperoxide reductase [Planctomycetaceae bacterium]|nr:alkyl hydroperoxide reductase [Planctomycetaceae bacterium]